MNRQAKFFAGLHLLVVLAFALNASQTLYAQVDSGAILGTVKDQSGAVIPGAKVTVTNEGTSFTLSTVTRSDGGYIFSPLRIGTYAVEAEFQGFQKAIRPHVTVNVQQQVVADFSLTPGQVVQTVEVTASTTLLQTQNAAVGQVVNSRSVNDLPLNGRNFTFLAQIVAGAQTPQSDTRGNAASGAFSANGLQPAQNNYMLDGIDNNSNAVDFLNGTNFVVLPPVDAIQEFRVETADYSAQYGRAGGAILNATIKSGTNNIRGALWEFVRNDKLDAADFFVNAGGSKKGEYRLNQFGFSVGGPILIPHAYNGRNKAFFFGDYEGLRRRQGTVLSGTIPTALERNSAFTNFAEIITGQSGGARTDLLGRKISPGTILDPATTRAVTSGAVDPVTGLVATATGSVRDPFFTGGSILGIRDFTGFCPSVGTCLLNQIPAGRIDPNAVKLLNLYPTPTSPNLTSNFTASPLVQENRNAFDTRLDFNISDKDQIFGRLSYVDDPQFIPGPFGGFADGGAFQNGNQTATSWQGPLTWTHTFSPTTVNETRVGLSYIKTTRHQANADMMGIPAQFGIPGVPQVSENGGLTQFVINGLTTLGSNQFLPSDEVSSTVQATDDLTKIHGRHTFKMGFELQHIKYSTLQPTTSRGTYSYGSNFVRIPNGAADITGIAQLVLTPIRSIVPGGVDFVGGANQLQATNIFLTDDGRNYYGGYFEDSWKVSPRLTLNAGLRWDYFGSILENHSNQANLVPGAPNGGAQYLIPVESKSITLSPTFLSSLAKDGINLVYTSNDAVATAQNKNFAPRFGFAYQLNPKLVVRGGYGIFYGGFENLGYGPNIGQNYPFAFGFTYPLVNDVRGVAITRADGSVCTPAVFIETGFSCTVFDPSLVVANGTNPLALKAFQYDWKTPYTQGYNLTFQYSLTPSVTASVGYVGNVVFHLPVSVGANALSQVLPPGLNQQNFRPYADFGSAGYITTEGNSHYNGLQVSVQKHYSNGMNFLGAYTYSRTRTDAGDLLNGGSVGGYRAPYLPNFGIQADYRDAPFDVTNVFHFSGGYQLPFGKGKRFLSRSRGAVNQIAGGWQLNWSATVQGGQPLTIGCVATTRTGLGCNALLVPGQDPRAGPNNVDQFLNPKAFTDPPVATTIGQTDYSPLGGAPTQTRGPGFGRTDFSLFKDFQLTERFRLQFRSEFFNISNHPNFNAPGFGGNGVIAVPNATNFTSSNFGKIGSTRDAPNDPRQIQFALKLYF